MKIQIQFRNGKEPLTYEADSIAEAVRQAIENKDDLRYADLREAVLRGVDLTHADLRYADLCEADLSRANLTGANLTWANLSYADLTGANLSGADLSCANLFRSNLSYANLSNANFSYANLRNTKLAGAKLQGKQLWITRPFLSLGQCGSADRTTLVFFFEDRSEPFIVCGCFEGGLKKFKTKVKETHAGTFHEVEYNAMVDYIEALYKEQQEK